MCLSHLLGDHLSVSMRKIRVGGAFGVPRVCFPFFSPFSVNLTKRVLQRLLRSRKNNVKTLIKSKTVNF